RRDEGRARPHPTSRASAPGRSRTSTPFPAWRRFGWSARPRCCRCRSLVVSLSLILALCRGPEASEPVGPPLVEERCCVAQALAPPSVHTSVAVGAHRDESAVGEDAQ